MESKIIFKYLANGNLDRVDRLDDNVYQGQVAGTEYYFYLADGVTTWTFNDQVYIAFTRPDNAKKNFIMRGNVDIPGLTGVKGWLLTSTGWETDLGDTPITEPADLIVSFINRRLNASSTAYTEKPTGTYTLDIQPSSAYQNGNVSSDPEFDALADKVNVLETTVGVLNKVYVTNVTTDVEAGTLTKYFSDGTTATVNLPSGGGSSVLTGSGITVITFDADNWTNGAITFAAEVTGQSRDTFTASVDRLVDGVYVQTANAVTKGADGSITLSGVATAFAGRVVIVGGISTDLSALDAALIAILGV